MIHWGHEVRPIPIVSWRPNPLGQVALPAPAAPASPAPLEPVPVIDSTAMRFVTDGIAAVGTALIALQTKNKYVKGALWSLSGLTGLFALVEGYRLVR